MHVLVTGSAGFIGRSVVRKALDRGWNVTAVARQKSPGANLLADLRQPMNGWPVPDAVIHLAGAYAGCGVSELSKHDLTIARNLIAWGKGQKVSRWIFASAAEVYGRVSGVADESYPCNPVIPYGKAKLEIERMLQLSGFEEVTICRLGEVYGPEGRILRELGARLASGFCPWPGSGNVKISFLHVHDAAEALVLACESTAPGYRVYNVGDDEPATWREFLEEFAGQLNARPPRYLPMQLARSYAVGVWRKNQILRRAVSVSPYVLRLLTTPKVLSSQRLKKELGYVPRVASFREGLPDSLQKVALQ